MVSILSEQPSARPRVPLPRLTGKRPPTLAASWESFYCILRARLVIALLTITALSPTGRLLLSRRPAIPQRKLGWLNITVI
jgi:hypothetical protein